MNKKSQASLEYLSTYAWVFIIISVTVVVLYYSGVFDFDLYLPEKCVLPSQFKCLDFSFRPDEIRFKLVNNLGEDISVQSIHMTDNEDQTITCASVNPSPPFNWNFAAEQNIHFSSCQGGSYYSGERIDLKISMEYYAINTPSRPIHTIYGKINGKIASK